MDPDNADIVEAWLVVGGQWRYAGFGTPVSLDFLAVESGLRMAGIDCTPDLFWGLRVMADAARPILQDRDGEVTHDDA